VSGAGPQTRWARTLAAALADQGVDEVVVSPGSRSTPLVLALAAEPDLTLRVLLDERAAAFFALGRARVTGAPTALVCTSGTAGAHYLPAVVEASRARLPLIAITADRPPELQERDAPQTIDQTGLFGRHVRLSLQLGTAPPDESDLAAAAEGVARAVHATRFPEPGPVHLNVAFRKPFEPPRSDAELPPVPRAASRSFPPALEPDPAAVEGLTKRVRDCRRGLIVCGPAPLSQRGLRGPLGALARGAGLPVAAEASSQLRLAGPDASWPRVDGFEALLRCGWWQRQRPDLVLQLGAHPTASRWPELWRHLDGERHVVARWGWHDPAGGVGLRVLGDPRRVIEALLERLSGTAGDRGEWVERVAAAERVVREEMARTAGEGAAWSEPRALGAALSALPPGALLQLANSLPVREIDAFCDGTLAEAGVLHQRGAMGIDGLVAGAAGAAHASGRPVLAVVGDVALFHDAGSLPLLLDAPTPLVLLVLDNGGGRLFEALPIGAREDLAEPFERFFLTPPGIDPVAVARGFGLRADEVADDRALTAQVAEGLAGGGPRVVVARLPGPGPEVLQRQLAQRVDSRLRAPGAGGEAPCPTC
jgi:2-succinyl-5-enolpyruvyl-6-hydroxy-3-cyclohexene-1-carboxylate synthase